jgi:hypothetical protein
VTRKCTCGGIDIGVGVMHEPDCELRNDGRLECDCGYRLAVPLVATEQEGAVCGVCGAVYVGRRDGTSGGRWERVK